MIGNTAQPFGQNDRLTDELARQSIQNPPGALVQLEKHPGARSTFGCVVCATTVRSPHPAWRASR
jgi:hypothetical protein